MTLDSADLYQDDFWFAYECLRCPKPVDTGVTLDLRINKSRLLDDQKHPTVKCPFCSAVMHYAACWAADSDGYGSRGGSDRPTNLVRAAAALERQRCLEVLKARIAEAEDADVEHQLSIIKSALTDIERMKL